MTRSVYVENVVRGQNDSRGGGSFNRFVPCMVVEIQIQGHTDPEASSPEKTVILVASSAHASFASRRIGGRSLVTSLFQP